MPHQHFLTFTFLLLLFPILHATQHPPSIPSISRLQAYLRIQTDHPEPDYASALSFLNHTMNQLLPDASFSSHEFVPGKPVIIITIRGTNPTLPSLLLNSHTDVVPAEPSKWSVPPFEARLVNHHDDWRVYARGAQDMKSVGMQYLEALALLTARGWVPARDIHVSFVPDEEIGGASGMGKLVESPVFQQMNVGVAMDEGLPNPNSTFNVYYGERKNWWVYATVRDAPGHGANLPQSTAAQVMHSIQSRAFRFRDQQLQRKMDGADMGDVTTVNLVYVKGGAEDHNSVTGFTMNVIPSVMKFGFDIRIPPSISEKEMDEEIESWFTCDGTRCPGATYDFAIKVRSAVVTSRDPALNPFIVTFNRGLKKSGISNNIRHGIFHAATDSRTLRAKNIPCFGFSPIENTENLLHKHDEYVSVKGYLRGTEIYEQIIPELAAELVVQRELEGSADESNCQTEL